MSRAPVYCRFCGHVFENGEEYHKVYFNGKMVPCCKDGRTCNEKLKPKKGRKRK